MDVNVKKEFEAIDSAMQVGLKTLQSYPQLYYQSLELINQHRVALRTRLVWYVGISGYVLLNAKTLWDSVAQRPIVGLDIFWLSVPWIICSLLGVVAYFLSDEISRRTDKHMLGKMAFISTSLIPLESSLDKRRTSINNIMVDQEEINKIIDQVGKDAKVLIDLSSMVNDQHPDYVKVSKDLDKLSSWSSFFERSTFLLLVLGFIWLIVGPLILL